MLRNRPIVFSAATLLIASLAAVEAEGDSNDISTQIDIPVSVGQVLKGMRLPYYEKNKPDKLSLRLNADEAERSSDTQFKFKGLRIELFEDSAEKPAMEVILNDAIFDQQTNLLRSLDRAKIKGEQFEIVGHQLEFDSKTRNSRLLGPVFMTLTELEEKASP
jgi:hypothetical protein